ncbi:MAG: transglycosylase SLT domain-containing protein [Bdellovibrionaceae bacterium]|nr:transglycosylase SLT domain-containing protein [Pseudobdellovibrionaceae bacterium]
MNIYHIAALGIFGALTFFKDAIEETIEVNTTSRPTIYDELFKKYGSIYGVPWQWLAAIAENESNTGRAPSVKRGLASPNDIENSKSSDGKSWGLMQVTIKTAKALDPAATEAKLNNPEYSIKLAAMLLKSDSAQFSKLDLRYMEWVIKSYNQGAPNTKKEMNGWRGPWTDHVQQYWERFQANLAKVQGS